MKTITYSLSGNYGVDSDAYYRIASTFTDEVLKEAEGKVNTIVQSYYGFLNKTEQKQYNASEEMILELLILGVLMKVYSSRALKLSRAQYRLLTRVNNIRKSNENLKPAMNYLKGVMSTLFLFSKESNKPVIFLDMDNAKRLNLWLEASGEFSNEVKRLRKWEAYFESLARSESLDSLKAIYDFALWFEKRSNEVLGEYTYNVDKYLESIKKKSNWREDIILRQRNRVEYHLNMVGAEIMNRVFRKAFIATNEKVLLLPVCMTSPSKSSCQSESFGREFKCKGCSNKCQVNKLIVEGKKLGFSVMVVPHESSISSDSRRYTLFDEDTGVVGVACVLNLIAGGWLLKDMNIPAQCVLLDYCGCKKHWHDTGISTCINLNKLQKTLISFLD